ncbi:MAG: HAD family hydrolase [Neobacillus sp.]
MKKHEQTLILDLDDTLVHCNKYFVKSKNKFVNQMRVWFDSLNSNDIKQKQAEIDINKVEKHGLLSSVYVDSLVATYQYFCNKYNRKATEHEMELLRIIGREVFQIKVQPFPYMYKVLNKLKEDGHQLCLFTGGDEKNQVRKIKQLKLRTYFDDRVFIYEHKNKHSLQEVLTKLKADRSKTWMIGNSLRSDIKPAIELGINAIHIPSEIEWSYNIIDLEVSPNGTYAELKSLKQLPDYLAEYSFTNQHNNQKMVL